MDIRPVKELDEGSAAWHHETEIKRCESGTRNQELVSSTAKFSKDFAGRG